MSPLRRSTVRDRPLSCREVSRVLQRYLDGEIDDAVAARVAEHLDDCRRCGLEAAVYRQIKESLARATPDVPESAIARLRRFGEELVGGGEGDGGDGEPG